MKSVIRKELEQNGFVVTRTDGDSMRPLLRHHQDVIVVEKRDPKQRMKKYDVVLYQRSEDSRYTLHRIIKVRKHDYVICGDNRWHWERGITDEQIIGRLKEIHRNGKHISVENIYYRMYVHLWCDFFYLRAALLFVRDFPQIVKKRLQGKM